MAYATDIDVKVYLGIPESYNDDNLISDLITRATGIIDGYTGRHFEAETVTKYFNVDQTNGKFLNLDGFDLLSITKLSNGDSAATEITSAHYRLLPRNDNPKWAIRLDDETDWEWADDDSEITVAGTWGYATTAPADIEHACVRLASFLYRQKDTSADIDRPMVTGDGVTIMPSAVPADVRSILDRYKRRIA
jgi:hypothetical protein